MTSISPKAAIDQLLDLTDQANTAVNDVAAAVKRLEDLLESRGVGIEACVDVRTEDTGDGRDFQVSLAYRRYSSRFRFVVVQGIVDCDDFSERAWSECPRDMKLETFGALPKLLHKMSEEMKSTLKETRRTTAAVAELIDALDSKAG